MRSEIFSVLDMVAKTYLEPFCAPNVATALRSFKEAVQKDGHQFAKFPEDYALYHIGTFDGEVGELATCDPHKIGTAIQFAHGFGNQLEIEKNGT